jgi:TP901 family phage tail tape measure protein
VAEDFSIDGKVNIDYSAFDAMSAKGAQAYEKLKKPFDRMVSDFAQIEQKLDSVAKKAQAPFSTLHPAFVQATLDVQKLSDKYDSLNKKQKALYDIASKTAGILGGKDYNNLSTQIDTALSTDFRPTRPVAGGGVEIGLSSREKNLAIVTSMTARLAAEDAKLARQEQILAGNMREVTQGFDQAQKERQEYMQTTYRAGSTSAFTEGLLTPEAAAMQKVLSKLNLQDVFSGADDELVKLGNQLPRIRYALYDVAASATATGAALVAMALVPVAFSIKAERAFADVVRTSKATGDEIATLRKEFVDLQQTIPESFAEITKIGALAGQLNIAKQSLTSFTETVAMFSATTNVNVQDAATAFGRLDQLIDGINGRYQNLGSSILAVGVNSVATESQIIAIAQQIASIANLAKFSADQVIGLSGALASVGTSPELSRGIVTRLFGNIQSAIAEGGEALKKFGAVSGQSAADFKYSWETNAAGQLLRFLKGINEDGTNAETTLRGLGIASIRDIPAILKLAQGWEEVADSLNTAREGFVDNTELQKQYGTITATVSDKLQLLSNNFEALMATIGGASTALIPLIDFAVDFLKVVTDILSNPVGQFLVGLASSVTLVGGALALLVGGLAFGAARFTAIAQAALDLTHMQNMVQNSMTTTGDVIKSTTTAMGQYSSGIAANTLSTREQAKAIAGAVVQANAFKTAIKGTLIGLGITAGLALIAVAWEAIANATKSAGEKSREYFNKVDVSQAIAADTKAYKEGILAYDYYRVAQEDTSNSIAARKQAIVGSTDVEKAYQAQLDETTKSAKMQTVAFGENYASILAGEFGNKVINEKDNPLRGLFDDPKLMESFKASGLNALDVIKTTIKDGAPAAIAEINAAFNQIQAQVPQTKEGQTSRGTAIATNLKTDVTDIEKVTAAEQAFIDLANATAALTEEEKNTIEYQRLLGVAIEESATEAEIATEKLKEYKDAVANAFLDTNTVSDFADSFQKLAEGIGQGGNSFSSWSAAGRTNLANFQDSVAKAIRSGESMGLSATETVAALFASLQAQGIDTANLLAQVSSMNIAGFDPSRIQGLVNSGAFDGIASGFDGIVDSANDAGSAVGGVAEKVRTLLDYAGDLEAVYSRAFDIRFDSQSTLDDIASSFQQIAEATADANEEITDLNNEISKLTADKALKEYFLSVAEAYGDTIRAAQLRAEIAEIDADLADSAQDLAKAQGRASKTLVGNSEAAIDNRAEVLGLVSSYQSHIRALAASGMSQDQLAIRTAELRQDFLNQATALGYNSSELGIYASAFDDVSYAIDNVPRDITVDVDANPAVTALNEIKAAAESASGAMGNIPSEFPDFNTAAIRKAALSARITSYTEQLSAAAKRKDFGPALRLEEVLGRLVQQLNSGDYATGGYTGAGGKYEVAGIVHRGEYVVPKEQVNQSTGTPYFMQQPRSFAQGGYAGGQATSMMVELSPTDRALLRSAGGSGEVVLYANNEAIARSSNAGNRQIVATGGRP